MTPTSGPVGTIAVISVVSTSFPIGGSYQVRWSPTATFDDPAKVILLAEGETPSRNSMEISASFIVPESKYGVNYVQLVRYGADEVLSFQFSVKPVLKVEPATSYPGDTVTISGMGFPDNDTGEVIFDGTGPKIPFSTSAKGSFSTTFIVPETIAGAHRFVATAQKLYAESAASNLAVEPFINLTPQNPSIGEEVTLSGSGFAANSELTIDYNEKPVGNSAVTNEKGSFTHTFTVSEAGSGDNKVIVTDKAGNSAKYGMPLETIPPPKPSILAPKDRDQVFGFMGNEFIVFSWTPVTDPSGVFYTIEIAESLDFFPIKPGLRKSGMTETSCVIEVPPGTYFWRVRAIDGAGNEGEWQQSPNFFKVGIISFWYLVGGGAVILIVLILLVVAFLRRLREYYG